MLTIHLFSIFPSMKWIAFLLFGLCLQSTLFPSGPGSMKLEDNSIYFKKGVYKTFFNDPFSRIREIQSEYPGIVFELSLYQLESEPLSLAVKRNKTLIRRFQEAGLDMDRIIFDSRAIYVKDFKNHLLSLEPSAWDSVGAVLEGKVQSL